MARLGLITVLGIVETAEGIARHGSIKTGAVTKRRCRSTSGVVVGLPMKMTWNGWWVAGNTSKCMAGVFGGVEGWESLHYL